MSFKKFIAFGCSHGDLIDSDCESFLQKFIADFKPDLRIHLGDAWDYRALRKGIGNSDPEAFDDLEEDTTRGFLTLERLQANVLLLGNHDYRLYRIAHEHGPALARKAAKDGVKHLQKWAKANGCKLFPYHVDEGVFKFANGQGVCVHGYSANNNSLQEHIAYYCPPKGTLIMAHLHTPQYATARKHGGADGYCVGTIAESSKMHYAAHRFATSRWGAAFTFGEYKGNQIKTYLARRTPSGWTVN